MPSKTQARNKKGQVVAETALCLSFFATLTFALFSIIIRLSAWSYISFDSFILARAHLYAQKQVVCEPSKFWPRQNILRVKFYCDHSGKIKVISNFSKPIFWELQ